MNSNLIKEIYNVNTSQLWQVKDIVIQLIETDYKALFADLKAVCFESNVTDNFATKIFEISELVEVCTEIEDNPDPYWPWVEYFYEYSKADQRWYANSKYDDAMQLRADLEKLSEELEELLAQQTNDKFGIHTVNKVLNEIKNY